MFFVIQTALLEKWCQFSPKHLYAVTDAHLPSTSEFISTGMVHQTQNPSAQKLPKSFGTRKLLDAFSSGDSSINIFRMERVPSGPLN